jgi:hypothetical protein
MRWPTVPKNLLPAVPATPKGADDSFARKVAAFRKNNNMAERFVVACVCAKTNRPFQVRYERFDPTASFRIVAVEKVSPSGGAAGRATVKTLPVGKVDFAGWHCPSCLDRRCSVQCQACHTTVCSGRVVDRYDGEYFICRDSCGCEGLMTESTEIHGTDERLPQRNGKRTNPPDRRAKLCAPKPAMPRLSGPRR